MKNKIFLGIQVISGLMLVVFGLNGFLHFMPMPKPDPLMGAYLGALFATGFIFPIVATIELIAGIAYLSNKFAPLMAVILMPIMLNAFLSHLFLDIGGIGGSLFILIATIIVMLKNKERYRKIFKV
ncbi:MAG: hypothetical protein QM493_09750 [Sulfurovum sp.]